MTTPDADPGVGPTLRSPSQPVPPSGPRAAPRFAARLRSPTFATGALALLAAACLVGAVGAARLPLVRGALLLVLGASGLACLAHKVRNLVRARAPWRSAFYGSVLFHGAIFWVFAAGLAGSLYRFEGHVEIGEGQGFTEDHGSYIRIEEGPLFDEASHAGFAVLLEAVDACTDHRDRALDYASLVTIREASGRTASAWVRPNEPFHYRGFDIYQGREFGKALLMSFRDRTGGRSVGYVNLPLAARPGDEPESDFLIPGTGLRAHVRLRAGRPAPTIALTVEGDGEHRTAELSPGASLALPRGELTLEAVRSWSRLIVCRDPSTGPVFAGLVAGLVGLVWSMLGHRGGARAGA